MHASSPPESFAPLAWLGAGRWRHVLICAFFAFFLWGLRPAQDSSDARYSECARQMVATGDWLVPHLRGQRHLSKPPLAYWAGAAGMSILGQNTWGARLFLACATLLACLAVTQLAREWGASETEARLAGVVQATGAFSFMGGHVYTTDAYVALWQLLAALCAWKAWNSGEAKWRIGFWAALGLAFLTKGPPGWLVAIPVLVTWIARRRELRGSLFSIPGVVLFLAFALSWFGFMIAKDPALLDYYVEYEIVKRVTSEELDRAGPFWMFVPITLFGMFPWFAGWTSIGRRLRERWEAKDYVLRGVSTPAFFATVWVVSSLVVFTVSKSRLPLYALPFMPPIAIYLARIFAREHVSVLRASQAWRRAATAIAIVWGLGLVGFLGLTTFVPQRTERGFALELKREYLANSAVRYEFSCPEKSTAVPFSFDFYLRSPVFSRPESKNLKGLSLRTDPDGTKVVPISLVKTTQLKKMKERGVSYVKVLEGGRFSAVSVPEAAGLLPKGELIAGDEVPTNGQDN